MECNNAVFFIWKRENVNTCIFPKLAFMQIALCIPMLREDSKCANAKGFVVGGRTPSISLLLLAQTQLGPQSQNKNQTIRPQHSFPRKSQIYKHNFSFEGSTFDFFPWIFNKLLWKRYLYYVPFSKTKAYKESCHWITPSALIKVLHNASCRYCIWSWLLMEF